MLLSLPSSAYLLLAGSLTIPLLHLCLVPRFIRMFPRAGAMFAGATLGYWALLGAIAWWLPVMLPWAAAVSAAGWAWIWWRSRDDYGRSRQLPPGSLAMLPLQPWMDRFYYTKLGRRYGPIYKTSHHFHPMICFMNIDSSLRLLKAHDDRQIRSPKVMADRFLPCGFLRGMDPANHATYRRLLQSLITPPVLAAWEPTIARDLRPILADLQTHPEGAYAKPGWDIFLLRSFARLFFGIHPESAGFAQLAQGFQVIKLVSDRRISVPWLPSERRTRQTLDELSGLLMRQTAPDCLLAELRRQPDFSPDPQSLRLLLFVVYLSSSDVAGLLQWLLKMLCDHPEAGLQLRAEVDAGITQMEPDSFARRFTLETLRLNQVEHLYRRVLEDFEWDGYRIPKGWLLRVCLSDAHRDPAVFNHAADFRPDRFLDPPPQSEYLPFGAYQRSCPGDKISHVISRVFLSTLTSECDWRQVGECEVSYAAWHWIPGYQFRVLLTPRAVTQAA